MKQLILKLLLVIGLISSAGIMAVHAEVPFELLMAEITGTVTDENGDPLIGATVTVKGSNVGTVTDPDGSYRIDAEVGDVLVFSYLGYAAQEITVGTDPILDVRLSGTTILEDVVVVAYGTQKRSDITGSIAGVDEEEFNRGVVTNPGQLLQGKVAGVNVSNVSGEPGAAQNVIIRGIGSLRSGTTPLFVVDGFVLDNSSGGLASNPLNFLNPSDIASIDVLKDASAAAIYGARASNGVVVITTKKGKVGTTETNVSASTAFSNIAKTIPVFGADEFKRQVGAIGGRLEDFGGSTDWQDELTQTGISNNLNLSMSGAANERFSYYASAGYQDQEGILKNSNLKRYSGKLNINQTGWNGRFNLDLNLTAAHTENLRPNIASTLVDMLEFNPTLAARDSQGEPTLLDENRINPLARNEIYSDMAANNRILANIAPSLEIVRGLTYKLNFGVDYSSTSRDIQWRPYAQLADLAFGSLNTIEVQNENRLVENTLTYETSVDLHQINVLVGHSYQKFIDQLRSTNFERFADNGIDPIFQDHTSPDDQRTIVNSQAEENELQSFFGRINYGYDGKYLLTATMRADGSSKFGGNNKYGYFPSVAVGWNITKEDFFSSSLFDNLKFRASWGQTGNQEIPSKITQESFNETRSPSGGASNNTYPLEPGQLTLDQYPFGVTFSRLANPDIQWEVSTQTNVGLDFALLDYRLTGTIDYFSKVSDNILLEISPADPIQPTATFWTNIPNMEIRNNGLELALDYSSNPTTDLQWSIGGNISLINNKIKDSPFSVLATGVAQGAGQTGATINGYINDEAIGAFYMQTFNGIGSDGLNLFADTNGDDAILDNDRTVVGSALPNTLYAFHINLEYGGFDLGLNFNGVAGNKVYNHTAMTSFIKGKLAVSSNTTDFAVEFPNEEITNFNEVSTRFLEDADFLRLNNLTLGYNINTESMAINDVIKRARVSLTGQNLFVLTQYSGFDPEVNTGNTAGGIQTFGIDRFSYPSARTILLALDITF
ncbi:MAG: TonB-dependent receptor [Saprospiraceae bacterium]|nr:TonB-dependent receptor [Saprospiraceae bacterium]